MLPIYIVDPGSSSALVMFATPSPVLFKLEAILKVDRKGVAWHDSATKEVLPHPVVGRLVCKYIRLGSVAKNVQEELPTRLITNRRCD